MQYVQYKHPDLKYARQHFAPCLVCPPSAGAAGFRGGLEAPALARGMACSGARPPASPEIPCGIALDRQTSLLYREGMDMGSDRRRQDMGANRTTYRSLNDRAAAYVATLDVDDPVVVANRLVDRAVALQDEGRLDEAADLLGAADRLLRLEIGS